VKYQRRMMQASKQMKDSSKTMRQQFAEMLAWTASPPSNAKSGKPYVAERKGILELHFDRLSIQSEMDIGRPDELVLSYTRAMMSFLLLDPSPKHITMIGLGGGSLAKYCYRYLPQTDMTVVEINPDVIALRNAFAIPPDDARFRVLLGDGAAYVSAPDKALQILMVDGFDADGQTIQLSSQKFYNNCYSALEVGGMMVANLWGSNPGCQEYVEKIKNSFANRVLVVNVNGSSNKIAIALKNGRSFPSPSTIRHNAGLLGLTHSLDFQEKSNQLISALLNQTTEFTA
jgi:spermidine synthase